MEEENREIQGNKEGGLATGKKINEHEGEIERKIQSKREMERKYYQLVGKIDVKTEEERQDNNLNWMKREAKQKINEGDVL